MTVGTKSVLFGAHCFPLHGWFVARAWWILYGFPWNPILWCAFFLHDIGYLGKPNMDGPEGETHPRLGAYLMSVLFDFGYPRRRWDHDSYHGGWLAPVTEYGRWGTFTLTHSRYYAKSLGMQPSRLCVADKLAIALVPAWLYLPMVRATGEIKEYMAHAPHRIQGNTNVTEAEKARLTSGAEEEWYAGVQSYCRRWVAEHKDGRADTWTSDPRNRARQDETGTWR
jgi:hypothetical protein